MTFTSIKCPSNYVHFWTKVFTSPLVRYSSFLRTKFSGGIEFSRIKTNFWNSTHFIELMNSNITAFRYFEQVLDNKIIKKNELSLLNCRLEYVP